MNQKQLIGIAGAVSAFFLGSFSHGSAIGQSEIDQAVLNSSSLAQHNTYRAKHQAPALTSSDLLTTSAQRLANKIAATGKLEHSSAPGVGENLYVFYSSELSINTDALSKGAVKAWYDEIKNYDFANPGFSSSTGHFTQVVWKATTQVGCGVAQGGSITLDGTQFNAFYVVCQYKVPGNLQGAFPENVVPKQ